MKNASSVWPLCLAVAGLAVHAAAQAPARSSAAVSPSTLRQVAYIKASTPGEEDKFGDSIALSGDGNTLAVGAPLDSSPAKGINGKGASSAGHSSGAVYVYARNGSRWGEQAYIKASNPGSDDQFGLGVGLSADGNTLVVSAPYEDSGATGVNGNQEDNSVENSGAVYVFSRTGGTWSQQAYLKASNPGEKDEGDQFGYSISVSDEGNTLAVGAIGEDSASTGINGNQNDNSAGGAGAVYVFTRGGNAWSQQAYVKAANAGANYLFGYSVGLSADGGTLAVGSFDEAGSSRVINGPYDRRLPGSGAVYVFTRSGTGWSQQAYLKARAGDRGDSMGCSVAISDDGNTIAAGALDEDTLLPGINVVKSGHSGTVDTPDDTSAGAAYVFIRSGTRWTEQANFKASNAGEDDWFGVRLALSGDGSTLAVGAPNEDGAARGINGKQDDDSADGAGAVYLFTRSGPAPRARARPRPAEASGEGGSTWKQAYYVKGSHTEKFDEFGSAVALSRDGRTMAVGAHFESGGGKGVNGGGAGNPVPHSGAAYVFVR